MEKQSSQSRARLSLSLPPEQVEWLREMAWRKRQPLSHYVRDMIELWRKSIETAVPRDVESFSAPFPQKEGGRI
jgi:predicted DNA-binding protein